jgi:ArsR family transcriptional regulator
VRDCGNPDGCSEEEASDSLSKIAERFNLSLSTVSHHVKELRNSGLITCEKRGQRLFCWVDPEVLRELERFAKGSVAGG